MAAHIETPEKMPESDLIVSLTGPYVAGLDTVANTTSAVVYSVLKHPEVKARVLREVDELFAAGDLDEERLLKKLPALNGAIMFTDYLYVDVSGSKSGTRNFSIGGVDVPASVTANLDLGIKGSAWTIAGEWRLQSTREATVDVLLGARYLDVKPRLSYGLNGDVNSIPTASRGGSFEIKARNWDAIVGLKARYAFGDRLQWYVPLYADIGAGDSELTWQAAAGLGYSFGWGDVVGACPR